MALTWLTYDQWQTATDAEDNAETLRRYNALLAYAQRRVDPATPSDVANEALIRFSITAGVLALNGQFPAGSDRAWIRSGAATLVKPWTKRTAATA